MVNEWMLPLFILFGPIVFGVCIGLLLQGSKRTESQNLAYRKTPTISLKASNQERMWHMSQKKAKEPRFDIRA